MLCMLFWSGLAKSDDFNSARAEAGRLLTKKWPKPALLATFGHSGQK